MKVIVDTCVWSQVFRHKAPNFEVGQILQDLIVDARVIMIGVIRQELLSGISQNSQFIKLKKMLMPFEDVPLRTEYFIKGAEFSNVCRGKGIQGSTIDYLICAIGHLNNFLIFTTDNDFKSYAKYLPIKLY